MPVKNNEKNIMYMSYGIENMFKLFSGTKKEDERDIEQVMTDIAENHKRNDYKQLYRLLKNKEIFVSIDKHLMPEGIESGDKFIPAGPEDKLKSKSILGPNDQPLVPTATKDTCASLSHGYVRMNWIEFLNMVLEIEDTDGTSLEGENSWVRLDKECIVYILNFYNSQH